MRNCQSPASSASALWAALLCSAPSKEAVKVNCLPAAAPISGLGSPAWERSGAGVTLLCASLLPAGPGRGTAAPLPSLCLAEHLQPSETNFPPFKARGTQRRGWCPPRTQRAQILMFAESFETRCVGAKSELLQPPGAKDQAVPSYPALLTLLESCPCAQARGAHCWGQGDPVAGWDWPSTHQLLLCPRVSRCWWESSGCSSPPATSGWQHHGSEVGAAPANHGFKLSNHCL